MKREQKLRLAIARTQNARTKLRLAGLGDGDDLDRDDAARCLDQAVSIMERMLDRQRTRDATQGDK